MEPLRDYFDTIYSVRSVMVEGYRSCDGGIVRINEDRRAESGVFVSQSLVLRFHINPLAWCIYRVHQSVNRSNDTPVRGRLGGDWETGKSRSSTTLPMPFSPSTKHGQVLHCRVIKSTKYLQCMKGTR